MSLLAGNKVVAPGINADRPLLRYLVSLGAELMDTPSDISELSTASFLVDTGHDAVPWPAEQIAREHPHLIQVSVTTFGCTGSGATLLGSELVASAMAGTLRLTGEPDREPVKEALDACTFHADMVAAAGAMAAYFDRSRSQLGQHVDVSIQEVAFSRMVSSILAWQFDRRKLGRVGGALNYGKTPVRCIWPLADGWCFHSLMTGRFGAPANQALSEWIDELGLPNPLQGVDWLSYNRSTLDADIRQKWEIGIATFFKSLTRADIRTEGRRRGINACVVEEPGWSLQDPHLKARGFWQQGTDRLEPAWFARQAAQATGIVRPIPAGERKGPLSGIRVLDFSWALVGSVTTKTLGDLGADVIKVESRTRPCLSRIDVQVKASTPDSLDDKPWFAHLNSSKRSLSLNMKRPEAMEVLGPLIEWADVVVENFSPGTMARLGLDYDSLKIRNPGLVMVSGSVYGQSGPLAQEWGVDGTGGALSGRTFMTGWPDRDPVIPGAVPYGDVIVPYVMAATAAAALASREQRGGGLHIDAAMYEICVQQMYVAVMSSQQGEDCHRQGNDDSAWFNQQLWPAAGEDRWIAVSLRDEPQRLKLCELAGGEDIAAWTKTQQDYALMDVLQSVGIAAGVVQDIEDLMERDQVLAERKPLLPLSHKALGSFGHVRTPISFSRTIPEPYSAPAMGEHNIDIAASIAGLSQDRIKELSELEVFK